MLMESQVNPFDGQEAKPYVNLYSACSLLYLFCFTILTLQDRIPGTKMTQKSWPWQIWLLHINEMRYWNLRKSLRWGLLGPFNQFITSSLERITDEKMDFVQSNRKTIMDDPFIRNYIEDLLKNIRTQVLLKLIKPYTRIRIPFISKVRVILMPFSLQQLKFVLRVLSISPSNFCSRLFSRCFLLICIWEILYWTEICHVHLHSGDQRTRRWCGNVIGVIDIG